MKSPTFIATAFIGCLSVLNGAENLEKEIPQIATQIAQNPLYLRELISISRTSTKTDLSNNVGGVEIILATLSKNEFAHMRSFLMKSKHSTHAVTTASLPGDITQQLVNGHSHYTLENQTVVKFNVAPLGDCGLLSLPIHLSRPEAADMIANALSKGFFHGEDTEYLKEQHLHLVTVGQSLQQKHLKFIGLCLGFNVRFFSDIKGILLEDTGIKIKTEKNNLNDVFIFDGQGHFQALIPISDIKGLQHAYDCEQKSKHETAAYQLCYQ